PSIIIAIEEPDAAAHGFDDVALLAAREVRNSEAHSLSDIFELGNGGESGAVDSRRGQFRRGRKRDGRALRARALRPCGTQNQQNGNDKRSSESREATGHRPHSSAKDFLAQTLGSKRAVKRPDSQPLEWEAPPK